MDAAFSQPLRTRALLHQIPSLLYFSSLYNGFFPPIIDIYLFFLLPLADRYVRPMHDHCHPEICSCDHTQKSLTRLDLLNSLVEGTYGP